MKHQVEEHSGRHQLVQRERLLARLDLRGIHQVNLVCGPAGFGKSSAAKQWMERRDEPFLWLDLRPDDNDPYRLWSRVIDEAIQDVGLGVRARVALEGSAGSVRPSIERLAEDLDAYNGPISLVLDDLHLIESQDCLGSIELAIDLFPPKVRLVLISRSAPELPLHKYKGRGLLLRVGASDLAFDEAETLSLLVDGHHIPVEAQVAEDLCERAGGWPAVLYMSALWLQDNPEMQADPRTLPREEERITDFLMSEVLGGLDPAVREFLFRTSFLDWMSGELCDEVCGFSNSAEMLENVCRTNQLVEQDRKRRGWFRYHALMRDLLCEHRERSDPEGLARDRRLAIDWFLRKNMVDAAAEMAIVAEEYVTLADILEANHLSLSGVGRVATIWRWGSALPNEILDERPHVTLVVALAADVQSVPAVQVRRLLARVGRFRESAGPEWTPYLESFWQILSALSAGEGVAASIASSRIAFSVLEGMPDHQLAPKVLLANYLELAGELEEAEVLAREAIEDPHIEARPYFLIVASVTLAFVELDKGHVQASKVWVEASKDAIARLGLQNTRMEALVCSVEASVALSDGDLAHAGRSAEKSLHVVFEDPPMRVRMLLIVANVRAHRGQTAQAEAALDLVDEIIGGCPDVGVSLEVRDEVRAQIRSARSSQSGPLEPLSDAELRVLPMLEDGRSRSEIADELFLSVNTVKTHMRSIYRKLGASNREDAIAAARSFDLLRPNPSPCTVKKVE